MKPSRWLMQRAKAAKFWIRLTIVLALSSGVLLIAQASLLGRIVEQAYIHHQPLHSLIGLFVAFVAVIVIRAGLAYCRELTGFRAGAKLRNAVRREVMDKIAQLGPVYAARWSSGELSTMVMENVEALQGFYAKFLPQMTIAVMLPLVIVAFIFPYSWIAGIILLLTAPLVPLFMAVVGIGAAALNRRNYLALARMSATFLDVLQGLPTLKWFGQSKAVAEKVFRVSDDYRHTTMGVLRVVFLSSAVLEFFSALAIALLATYLGLTFLHYVHIGYWGQGLTLSAALFILILAPEFYMPLRELNTHYHARAEAIGAAESLIELLETPSPYHNPLSNSDSTPISFPPQIDPLTSPTPRLHRASKPEDDKNEPMKEIRLKDIIVEFPESTLPALTNLSLTIQAGEKLGISGPSGAGKSTLLNLIMGFVVPTAGQVIINDHPLLETDLEAWRQQLGWMGQSSKLFYGTIRENLQLFSPKATEPDMWKALTHAEAATFVKRLPDGLETLINEQNQGISGGQAQRITLARLYLQDAPIWILDEPTASLDRDCEKKVFEQLLTLSKNKTLILVTHKPTLIEQMDRTVSLSDGQLKRSPDQKH